MSNANEIQLFNIRSSGSLNRFNDRVRVLKRSMEALVKAKEKHLSINSEATEDELNKAYMVFNEALMFVNQNINSFSYIIFPADEDDVGMNE